MERLTFLAALIDTHSLPKPNTSNGSAIQTVLSIVFAITGAIAFLMITIAGFKYVVSRGDPQAIAGAKNTIIYALIGLLVSMMAFSIVTFVIGNL